MRSVYIIPISILFLLVGSVMGYFAKEIYQNQMPKESSSQSWSSEVAAFQEDDFLHSFSGIQDRLTDTEKVLGNKLIACIESKKNMQEHLAEYEEQEAQLNEQQKKDQSFIERFLGQSSADKERMEGEMIALYGAEVINPTPMRIVEARYRQIFPEQAFSHPMEEMFGYVEQAVGDVDAFLEKRIVENPGMSIVNMQRKQRSRFFEHLKTSAFEGDVDVFTQGAQNIDLHGRVIFKSPVQDGLDWIVITGDNGKTFETRTFAYDDESVWRYNSRNPSVILLNESCQWNDQYVYEYKDFFYLSQERMLVANIYCKKQNANTWDRVGVLKFEQIAE